LFQRVRWRGRCSDCSAVPLRLAALLLATAAGAEEPAAPASSLERVVVTGSHIPQTDVEAALPVQVLTREDIERSGVTTVEQLLERVPANVNPINAALTDGKGQNPGPSAANLRGPGGGSTRSPWPPLRSSRRARARLARTVAAVSASSRAKALALFTTSKT